MEENRNKPTDEEINYIFKLIDLLSNISKNNTLLLWQGVNRSLLLFGSAIVICTFIINIDIKILPGAYKLSGCAIIASLSMIGNRFLLFSIKRNSEHVYKYDKAIEELEKIIKAKFKPSLWTQYLPYSVWDKTLKGKVAARHNKQVARWFPCIFYTLSVVGLIVIVTFIFYNNIDFLRTLYSGCINVIIGFGVWGFVDFVLRPYVLEKTLKWIYKGETEKWDKDFMEGFVSDYNN